MKSKPVLTLLCAATMAFCARPLQAQKHAEIRQAGKQQSSRPSLHVPLPSDAWGHGLFSEGAHAWSALGSSKARDRFQEDGKFRFPDFPFEQKRFRGEPIPLPSPGFSPVRERQNLSDDVRAEWTQHYVSELAPGYDISNAIAIDTAGNVYVTGYSSNLPFGADYLTAKYNASGVEIWTARYNGIGNGADLPSAIRVDELGNVYVTGRSIAQNSRWDYATLKYNASGVQQWIARYNGLGNSDDMATALVVDASGNVYVTGQSAHDSVYVADFSYNDDYAIIKYNSAGVQQWVRLYNGPKNSRDQASAIGLDVAGNIYVTGGSYGASASSDYLTLKYNSMGVLSWEARYNGPGNSFDSATDLVIDGIGNIYITGLSVGFGTSSDYATIKYNAAGAELWVARYNGPASFFDFANALAVDGSGNVYVTGRSEDLGASSDYATIKYNSFGIEQWVTRSVGTSLAEATAVAVNASGEVYVTGSNGTIKYDRFGVQQWVMTSSIAARTLALDGSGNVCVAGYNTGSGTGLDYATVKYTPSGFELWSARYSGPGNSSESANAMILDNEGNAYLAGRSEGLGTSADYFVIKYNAAGIQQWIARYNGPGNSFDEATALAVDALGNLYVTGRSVDISTFYDYATIKYTPAGVEQWVARYNGPANFFDEAVALAVDASGNAYVTGRSLGAGTSYDYATIKYNSSGVEQWVMRYNDSGNSSDEPVALALDGSRNVYVTGYITSLGSSGDYGTVKYNSSGIEQWVARYNGSANFSDEAAALALDGSGNVYVTGYSTNSGTDRDYATIKYNFSGIEQWVARYSTIGFDEAVALALDSDRNVYVTGLSQGSNEFEDYVTIKYSSSGAEQWLARYNSHANNLDRPSAIAVDPLGNAYVTGYSYVSWTLTDYATVKYNSAGVEQWVALYNGPGDTFDNARALAVTEAGHVYVTGSNRNGGSSIVTTIKYVQDPSAVKEQTPGPLNVYRLGQNYPNPFNPITKISYALPQSGHALLKIYNLAGHEVATLVNEKKAAGEHEVQWSPEGLPSGVYVYRLQAGDFVTSKKLVLLK